MSKSFRVIAWLAIVQGCCGGCERSEGGATAAGKLDGHSLILITLDTTRADHLGCYGSTTARTPTLDRMAARGIRFARAYTPVPLTLPSHCSIFTGRYPKEHGLRDNGRQALPDHFPTLATIFKEHGYRTGAFIASIVLESRFGLDRGFDLYSDDLGHVKPGQVLLDLEIPADTVTDRALSWLDENRDERFFCWVHYFDAHDPYEPPPAFRAQHEHPYDGEIAFVDTQIRRIVNWLERSNLASRTCVVIVGDHGESFGEHGNNGHTIFLYETNLHVPMIFVHPEVLPSGHDVESVVELVDVLPTVMDLYGWTAPAGLLGRSLVPALARREMVERPVYSENQSVTTAWGWAQQRSLTTDRWKYISSTRPELYDLRADAEEMKNLVDERPDVARKMLDSLITRYEEMTPGQADDMAVDLAMVRALETLGYVSSRSDAHSDEFLTAGLPDPKDSLGAVRQVERAKRLAAKGKFPEAIALFEAALAGNPAAALLLYELGMCYIDAGTPKLALDMLRRAIAADPTYLPALVGLGEAFSALGRRSEAVDQYEEALQLAKQSSEIHAAIAGELEQLGCTAEASVHFQKALKYSPGWTRVALDNASLLAGEGKLDEAVAAYEKILLQEPDNGVARFRQILALLAQNRVDQAVAKVRVAIERGSRDAFNEVGTHLAEKGDLEKAALMFNEAAKDSDNAPEALCNLAVIAARAGRTEKALGFYERVLELAPDHERAIEALSVGYVMHQRLRDAIRVLRRGVVNAAANLRIKNSLAWLLATCRDDALRNGAEAVVLAKECCVRTEHKDAELLATLAAAQAEVGAFDQAVQIAADAIKIAEESGNARLVDRIGNQRSAYLSGRPYRDPQH
ncbi:MAG: sulfatase-like hydrolase/transferase [Planctomycetes bacterium]|nr:sulfatase-like hydrolase/transferase [Planctomycetota bacterium]